MPRRVRLAVIRQQNQSERLIGWIQLLIVLTFAGLYALSPRIAPEAAGFNPIPAVLAAYTLFTCVRLVLAHRGWLPRSFLILSAIADVLLLIVLIWSFHLRYHQPASFSLKAPTWAYVFIFIALRALRFEPRYVLVVGLTAMAGWTALVVYAILDASGPAVTTDFVSYVYGDRILIRAEVDKLMTIALVTIILALGLTRGRTLLVEAATDAEAARDLARFFSPAIARQIITADHPLRPGQGTTREAAVLNVDIKRFTRLATSLSADQTIRLLTAYQARVVPIVRAHGGAIDKFLGDGIMAVFVADGAPGRYVRNAAAAGLAVAAAMAGWRPSDPALPDDGRAIEVSIGLAHGQVVIGAVGAFDRLEYTVIGHPVNLAAKLEKHTRIEPATMLVAGPTFDLAVVQGFEAPPGTSRRLSVVTGLDQPVPVVILVP